MTSVWTDNLEIHLDKLRDDLVEHRGDWPIIAERTGLALRTVRSIAYNTAGYQNPCLSTLVAIANAIADLEHPTSSQTTR